MWGSYRANSVGADSNAGQTVPREAGEAWLRTVPEFLPRGVCLCSTRTE